MHHSKLIKLLKGITLPEWKAFGKYLNSPYHHSGKRILSLYYVLDKYFPDLASPKLQKEAVFYKIYPEGKAYDSKILATLMSTFKNLLEDFFVIHAIREDPFLKKKILSAQLRKRNLSEYYRTLIFNLLDYLQAEPHKSYKNYLEQFLIQNELYFFHSTEKLNGKKTCLENAMENLDYFYVISKLRLACEYATRSKILSDEASIKLLMGVREIAQNELKNQNPVVSLYLTFLELFSAEKDEHFAFSEAEKDFLNFFPKLNNDEKTELLPLLLNFANHCVLNGKGEFLDKQFELYSLGLEAGLLIENNRMPDTVFSNIVMIGAAKKEYEWTNQFIETHQVYLEDKVKDLAIKLSKARLAFSKQEFELAADLLNSIDKQHSKYQLRIKSLSLRCLFEFFLNEEHYFDVLLAKIASLEKYLYRNKVYSEKRKASYKNFCRLLKKLVLIHYESIPSVRARLYEEWKDEFFETEALIHQKWLFHKFREIKE